MTAVLVCVCVAGAAIAATLILPGVLSSTPDAELLCADCGHRYEISADEYRTNAAARRCPRCGQADVEPVIAHCPHCSKPIRRSDLDESSRAYAERRCPHCDKKVAPGQRP